MTSRKPLRILIVDANRDAADMLGLVAESLGYQPTVTYDGKAAIASVVQAAPDLALVHIRMPCMDGLRLPEELRRRCGLLRSVAAVTGVASESTEAAVMKAGFDRFYAKPIEAEELRKLAREIESGTWDA